jgi:MoaA/NifB/PqqE/SkfB family radical SAM enzyme
MLDTGVPKLSITISLDGYRELHDRIRGVDGAFDKAIQLARELRELQKEYKNLFFIFGYTISKYNVGMLEKTYQCLRNELPEVTRNDIHINVAQKSDIYYNNSSLDIGADRTAILEELRNFVNGRRREYDAISVLEEIFLRNLVKYVETGRSPMKSRSLDASLFMDSYGTVFPSIMWDMHIGSIRDTAYSLDPIWNSDAAKLARKKILEGKEPEAWTACEAYQSIVANAACFSNLLLPAGSASKENDKARP